MPAVKYPFTPDERANALLAQEGTALLIGLCLEQQVRSEKAMIGPFVLRERLGTLDARKIAAMPAAKIEAAFRARPAIHRFPGMMARHVHALCKIIAAQYANRGENLWSRVNSAEEVFKRLHALPGFGEGKAGCGVRVLAKFGKKKLPGWQCYGSDDDLPWVFKRGRKI